MAFGSVEHDSATARVTRGLARHPIAIMLLARLAVDVREEGHGIGAGLLKDAFIRTVQAAEIGGLRAIIVHAKDNTMLRRFHVMDPNGTLLNMMCHCVR